MPSSPPPKPTVNFFTSAILLFGGSFGGTHLTALAAPYSQWSGLVGFLMFPIAFVAGMQLWPRVSLLIEGCHSLFRRTQHTPTSKYSRRVTGSFTFILTSLATSAVACLILAPPSIHFELYPGCQKILIIAGAIYGAVCWVLIQLGYLAQGKA